jgi:hypothetical protein
MWRVVVSVFAVLGMCQGVDAQSRVPAGCFVTDAERSLYNPVPRCFNEERAGYTPYSVGDGYSVEDIFAIYGFQFGVTVNISYDLFYKWQDAEARAASSAQSSDVHYGWYVTEFNRAKQLKALESKLRKACGSKCKKIKTVRSASTEGERSSPQQAIVTQGGQPWRGSFEEYVGKRK